MSAPVRFAPVSFAKLRCAAEVRAHTRPMLEASVIAYVSCGGCGETSERLDRAAELALDSVALTWAL